MADRSAGIVDVNLIINENSSFKSNLVAVAENLQIKILTDSKYTDDTVDFLLRLIILMKTRIARLEQWQQYETGLRQSTQDEKNDPEFYGDGLMAYTNVTMRSVRLFNVERELERVKRIVAEDIAVIEMNLHDTMNTVNQLEDSTRKILTKFEIMNQRVRNLETYVVNDIKDKTEKTNTEETKSIVSGISGALSAVANFIPDIGPILSGLIKFADAAIETIIDDGSFNYSSVRKKTAFDILHASGNEATILAKYLNDSNKDRFIMDVEGFGMINIQRVYAENLNTLKFMTLGHGNDIALPNIEIYERPVNTQDAVRFLGTTSVSTSGIAFNTLNFTSRVPYGCLAMMHFWIDQIPDARDILDGTKRRQVVLRVIPDSDDIIAIYNGYVHPSLKFYDRVQKYDKATDTWNTLFYVSGSENGPIISEEIKYYSLVENYTIQYSHHFILSFIHCMLDNIPNQLYDMENNNSYMIIKSLTNFVVAGSHPSYWTNKCSIESLNALFTQKYGLSSYGYLMNEGYRLGINYLTNNGPYPNMLDETREQYRLNVPKWIEALK